MASAVPKEALRSLIASLTGVPASRIYWAGEPEKPYLPIGGKSQKLTLNVVARATNGRLEVKRTYDPDTNTQTEEWGAHRVLTISVRADNFVNAGEGFDTLEELRLKLELPSSRATLRAADLSYVDTQAIQTLDLVIDEREISSAILDVRFMHLVQVDPVVAPFIEKVTAKPGPFTDEEVAALPVVDLASLNEDL